MCVCVCICCSTNCIQSVTRKQMWKINMYNHVPRNKNGLKTHFGYQHFCKIACNEDKFAF